jgi:PadR family transcriptional regulator, regulatory protein PadR
LGKDSLELLQGTLSMLILKALALGPMHGYAVAERIGQMSGDVLQVEEGSLYPALHRLEQQGLLEAEWGVSENNRRAKYYRLTRMGRRELESRTDDWRKLSRAVSRAMETA